MSPRRQRMAKAQGRRLNGDSQHLSEAAASRLRPMDFEIRSSRVGDEAGVVAAIRHVYDEYGFTWDPEEYHADLYDLARHYVDLGHAFLVATEGPNILGTAALKRFAQLPDGESVIAVGSQLRIGGADCSLERLYVPKHLRRSGIGSKLFQAVLDEARASRKTRMEIWSDKRFVDAHRLYQRMGAVSVGERICHDPDQSPEWGLRLDL